MASRIVCSGTIVKSTLTLEAKIAMEYESFVISTTIQSRPRKSSDSMMHRYEKLEACPDSSPSFRLIMPFAQTLSLPPPKPWLSLLLAVISYQYIFSLFIHWASRSVSLFEILPTIDTSHIFCTTMTLAISAHKEVCRVSTAKELDIMTSAVSEVTFVLE